MKLDKKQLPQLIVLGVLVVVCIGYVSFQFAGGGRSSPPPAPDAKAGDQARTPTDDSEKASPQDIARAMPVEVFPNLLSSPARRDPFIPRPLPGMQAKSPKQFTQSRQASSSSSRTVASTVRPIDPFRDISQNGGPLVPLPGTQRNLDSDFVITGVICGQPSVAIIRTPDKGRHIVKEGQLIDGRYKVIYISEDGALLAYRNRRIHVKLGGVKNAS